MAAKRKRNIKRKRFVIKKEIALLLFFAFFILYIFALYFRAGAFVGRFLRNITLGSFSMFGYFFPILLFAILVFSVSPYFKNRKNQLIYGSIILFLSCIIFSGIFFYNDIAIKRLSMSKIYELSVDLKSSGIFSAFFTSILSHVIGRIGIILLSFVLFFISLFMITDYSVVKLFKDLRVNLGIYLKDLRSRRSQKKIAKKELERIEKQRELEIQEVEEDIHVPVFEGFEHETFEDVQEDEYEEEVEDIQEEVKYEPNKEKEVYQSLDTQMNQDISQKVEYRKPPLSLLNKSKKVKLKTKDMLYDLANKIENILSNYRIGARVIDIAQGPIVNRFELELDPGIKLSKIQSLSDDIALNLAVSHVRIAAVAGKAAVGIEVPNDAKVTVGLRDILESKEFTNSKSPINFGVGIDISGNPVVADLEGMPHLLIAGATGSGKSVCINSIITSFLYKSSPEELKLIMIDPKVVELNVYNGIPHLMLPVVTDPHKAATALNWAVSEMVRRYNLFAENNSKDINSYNSKHREDILPKIVIIIDELSDLMMVSSNNVEDAIARITQMGRASGIHLIVATQRPSVDVITGTIKANIPSRIAFSVASYVDSKTILDRAGAEKLLGKGDMLYIRPTSKVAQRIQGAFISEEEVENIVEFIKDKHDAPEYREDIVETQHSNNQFNLDHEDDLFDDVIDMVISTQQASVSMLQRRFKIGHSRAGRLIDMLEDIGVIGPSMGSKPREVLVKSREELDEEISC